MYRITDVDMIPLKNPICGCCPIEAVTLSEAEGLLAQHPTGFIIDTTTGKAVRPRRLLKTGIAPASHL